MLEARPTQHRLLAMLLLWMPCALILPAGRVLADIPCNYPIVQIGYEADTLPEDDPQAPWQPSTPGDVSARVEDGVLIIEALVEGTWITYNRDEPSLMRASAYAMEARLWFADIAAQPTISLGTLKLKDGQKEIVLHFQGDQPQRVQVELSSGESLTYELNIEEPHVCRIEATRGGSTVIYVDGEAVIEVAYDDLVDNLESSGLEMAAFNAAESTSYWDYVRYSFCAPPEEQRPPIEEQIANMQDAAGQLDAPRPVQLWLQGHLEHAGQIDDPLEQGRAFYRIGRQLFMMKFAGVVAGDAAEFETLLDFARDTVAPELERRDGYLGKVEITAAPIKVATVVPGRVAGKIRIFATVKASTQNSHHGNKTQLGLLTRVGVVDIGTGAVLYMASNVSPLPQHLPAGRTFEVGPIDVEWGGETSVGGLVQAGKQFDVDVIAGLVQVDIESGEIVGQLDQAANLGQMGSALTDESCEHATRHLETAATPLFDEDMSWQMGWGYFFVNTAQCVPEPGAERCDPVLHLLDPQSGEELVSADDCALDMHYYPNSPSWAEINCCTPDGRCGADRCPDLSSDAGRLNPCLVTQFEGDLPRFVVHAAGNATRGNARLQYWRMVCEQGHEQSGVFFCTRIRYDLLVGPYPAAVGGTKVCFDNGWYDGDEMDAIIPSPEKADQEQGISPAHGTALYLLDEDGGLERAAVENSMGDGARLSNLASRDSASVIVASTGQQSGATSLYVNDVSHASERDGDGLGYELESEICTGPEGSICLDPDNMDTDGDGIFDGFEVLGIRTAGLYTEQDLPTWGADPLHKDVFIETDFYSRCRGEWSGCEYDLQCKSGICEEYPDGLDGSPTGKLCRCQTDSDCPTLPELQAVKDDFRYAEKCVDGYCMFCGHSMHPDAAAFAADIAKRCNGGQGFLENPDGRMGFSIHVDNIYASNNSVWGSWGGVDSEGVPTSSSYDGWLNYMSPIRHGIFHYALGIPANGSSSAAGSPYFHYEPSGRRGSGAGLVHELGHDFGLQHFGGPQDGNNYNFKPHYFSIMNYMYLLAGCIPNANAQDEDVRSCDPDNIGFSNGDAGFVVDEQGTAHDFSVNPAEIDENVFWYNPYFTRFELENFKSWYWTFSLLPDLPPWVIDWNRNLAFDTVPTKADVLVDGSAYFIHQIFEEPLRFGPQISSYQDVLLVFMVSEGSNIITYRTYHEDSSCDAEDVGLRGQMWPWPFEQHHCGTWLPGLQEIGIHHEHIASNMSIVPLDVVGATDGLLLFYTNSDGDLCVLRGSGNAVDLLWEGPTCLDAGFFGPPEAIFYKGGVYIFGIGQWDADELGEVKVIYLDQDQWDDPASWDVLPIMICRPGEDCELFLSRTTPAVAVDPGSDALFNSDDDTLLGIATNAGHEMKLFTGPVWRWIFFTFDWLTDDPDPLHPDRRHWLDHPRGNPGAIQTTDLKPALFIERTDPAADARWSLWFQANRWNPDDAVPYLRATSSVEPSVGTVFSRLSHGPEEKVVASDSRNVSIAFYREKLRAAVSYDHPWDYGIDFNLPDDHHEPGYVFLPVADGIFKAQLRDSNDAAFMAEHMHVVSNPLFLFVGMSDWEYQYVMDANHMTLRRGTRVKGRPEESLSLPHEDPPWILWGRQSGEKTDVTIRNFVEASSR